MGFLLVGDGGDGNSSKVTATTTFLEKIMDGVLLGMPGQWAHSNYEAADIYTSKIGGLPDWPFPIDNTRPDLLKCNTCGSNLSLVAQVYAPVSSKSLTLENRVIYVLGCLIPQCESLLWRALRVQKIPTVEESVQPCNKADHVPESSLSVSSNHWHSDDDSDDDIDLEELSRALSEAAISASSGKQKNSSTGSSRKPLPIARATDNKIPVMPCFYIYTQEEKLSKKVASESSKLSIKEYEDNSEDHSNEEKYEEESYEYDRSLSADRTYLKFKKRVDAYPEQCFRYSYGGDPLLASGETGEPGDCVWCGRSRHYEMQLMAPLIFFLEEAGDDQQRRFIEKFNWMTLLVYTCSQHCANTSTRIESGSEEWILAEEAVIVQYE